MLHIIDFYGEKEYKDLSARVFLHEDKQTPGVEFWKNNDVVGVRMFPTHSLQYAEDAAENYVLGILKIEENNGIFHASDRPL